MRMNKRLAAALRYASEGKRVFPLHGVEAGKCTCRDPDCDSKGKHPVEKNWGKRATVNLGIVRQWWEQKYPHANVGRDCPEFR